jgi:hypothetical protein
MDWHRLQKCSFSYNGDNKWEYDYYDCDKSCHCPLPTETNPSVVKGTMDCFQIPSAMSDRAFALELEDARRDFKKFFFTVPEDAHDNEAWEYMIYMRNARWKVKIHNAPSGTVDLCTASVSPLSPKTSRFTRSVTTERAHDVANCHEHIFSYLVTNSSGRMENASPLAPIITFPKIPFSSDFARRARSWSSRCPSDETKVRQTKNIRHPDR